jgi:hypothetical protein
LDLPTGAALTLDFLTAGLALLAAAAPVEERFVGMLMMFLTPNLSMHA